VSTRVGARIALLASRIAGALLVLFLAVPLVLLVLAGGSAVPRAFADPELRASLALTFATAAAATLVAMLTGTAVAYLLARRTFRGRTLLAAVLDLPLLIPHPVAGIAILLLVSRETPLGAALLDAGLRVVGTPAGIVAAMLFVAAPLYVSAAREALARVDERYELVARTLGDSAWTAFRRVTLPLARRGLLAAAVATWARAVSEFGAVVVLAYNPRVVSVLTYERLTTGGLADALPVAAVLVLVSLVPLVILRLLLHERGADVVR
jgi:molybdate/tungstate transport system permease protein